MKIEPLKRLLSGFLSAFQHNSNAIKIETAFQNTLSRDGSTPNDMLSPLDMGDNRIINVGGPINPNDAVRLQDIVDLAAGDLIVSTDWDDIPNKPTSFNPSTHIHPTTDITNIDEFVEDKIGSKVVAGSNITVSYNDTTGETTVSASGSLAGDWNTLLNKPATFTPSSHSHIASDITDLQETVEDYIGSAITAGTNVTVSYNDTTGKTTINSAGGGSTYFKSLEDFGGVGDGITDNLTAFANAQAGTDKRVYLNGTYYTTGSPNSIQYDRFWGPGRILFGTSYRPARNTNIITRPTAGSGVDLDYYFSGDITKIDAAYWKFGRSSTPIRVGISEPYYESSVTPYFNVMQSYQGYSGTSAFTTSSITTGATTVPLDLTYSGGDDLTAGKQISFKSGTTGDGLGGTILHTATSSGVSGSTLTFSPAIPSGVTIPSGSTVTVGERTMHALHYGQITHSGGGDGYIYVARTIADYQPTKGQKHFFNTSTTGLFGGDATSARDGVYLSGTEITFDGSTTDCAAIGDIRSFLRNNDTGARGATWLGAIYKSEGTKAINSGIVLSGKMNVGLDLAMGSDFGTNKCAIAMKFGDRIHFDNTPTVRNGVALSSDTFPTQPLYIGTTTVGSSRVIELYAGAYRLRLNEGGSVTTNAPITCASNIIAGGTLRASGGIIYLDGGDSFIQMDGSNIKMYKSGVLVQTW